MPTSLKQRRGFTLAEMMIAMVVGVLILSSAMSLAVSTFRSMAGLTLRDGIDRNSRFVGMVLQRDLIETGVDIESQANFGTLAVWADTISILRVPYRGDSAAPVYRLLLTIDVNGICDAFDCVYIQATSLPQIVAGDLVRYQYLTTRRLLLVSSVQAVTGGYRLNFVAAQNMLVHHTAGVQGMTLPSPGQAPNVLIQELAPVMYYRAGTQLMRASNLNTDGSPAGQVVGEGVQVFDASLLFTDADELTQADGADADATNDYNQIAAIRVRATLQSERADPRVNGGALLTRDFEWFVAPRNLIYERNRVGS